jgi:MazG family protein
MDKDDNGLSVEIHSLRETLRLLRSEGGCPWDRAQSLDDIISHLIDESYELLRAEKSGDYDEVEEELGDVLFLVVFVHELLLEKRNTPLADIVSRVHRKIVHRHPHVFGESSAGDWIESSAEWDRIKSGEHKRRGSHVDMNSIPRELPSLRKAAAIQKEAARVGFDWPEPGGILEKLHEEIGELESELERSIRRRLKEELGDILFTVVNLARWLGIDAENALETTSAEFVRRFQEMQKKADGEGKKLETMTLDEMEELWRRSKRRR